MYFVLFERHPSRADIALRIVQCEFCQLELTTEVSLLEHKSDSQNVKISPRDDIKSRDSRRKIMIDPNKPQDPPKPTDPNKPGR